MQKKSTSQLALVNLRVVVGLSIFLLGVFLALVGAATPSAPSRRFVATTGEFKFEIGLVGSEPDWDTPTAPNPAASADSFTSALIRNEIARII